MGLTGVILSASIRLMRVDFARHRRAGDAVPRPRRVLRPGSTRPTPSNEYVVAWLDQLASGNRAGRGLLMTGNHARHGARVAQRAGSRLAVPFQPPVNVLEQAVPEAFQRRLSHPQGQRQAGAAPCRTRASSSRSTACATGTGSTVRSGLYQHQSVVPEATARAAIADDARLRAPGRAGVVPDRAQAVRPDALAGLSSRFRAPATR